MKPVLDPASSVRSFYFNKTDERVVFGDIRENETHLLTNGQTIHIKPDQVMDFRAIPYPDETFQMVVFDPPHRIKLTAESDFIKKYGQLDKDTWQQDIKKGFDECWRCLDDYGVLVFKWNDSSVKRKELLFVLNRPYLFGHPNGSKIPTHWFVFMKISEGEALTNG